MSETETVPAGVWPEAQGLAHACELREVEEQEKRYDVSGELLPPRSIGLVKKPKVLNRLKDLPRKCWTAAKNESRGCQYCTKVRFGPITMEVMLDSGAGLNTIPEEALIDIINGCEKAGIKMSDESHPVVELQSWERPEECKGVAGGVAVPLIGGVILALTFVDRNSGRAQAVLREVQNPSR